MKMSHIKVAFICALTGMGALAIAGGGCYGWIQWDAHRKAEAIWMAYPQAANEVEAAILQMQSLSCTMKDRNLAVWVLGRLSDKLALPALEREYTGMSCQHDVVLCQSELKKAIRRCGGNVERLKETDLCDHSGLK